MSAFNQIKLPDNTTLDVNDARIRASSPSNGQILRYNSIAGKFENANVIVQQDSAPTNPTTGDLWIDTAETSGSGGALVTLPSGYSASTGITLDSSTLTTIATVGGVDLKLKAPAGGGGSAALDFDMSYYSGGADLEVNINFSNANKRCGAFWLLNLDGPALGFTCNITSANWFENYIWICNQYNTDYDVSINRITDPNNYNTISNPLYFAILQLGSITVPAGSVVELHVLMSDITGNTFFSGRRTLVSITFVTKSLHLYLPGGGGSGN